MSQIDFDGQVVIVTGAGRGIGRAYSLDLGARGARVVVNDLGQEFADAVVAEIEAGGGQAVASYHSVATREGAQALIDTALERFGTVDALINNAGIMRNGYFEDISDTKLDEVLDVHLRGSYFVTQTAWPVMRAKGYGRIVMTSSAGGMFAMQGESNYAAAKGGIYGLCKALASEGREHGILVNVVLPMATTTLTAGDPVPGYADRYPSWVGDALKPRRTTEAVAPLATVLASSACQLTGEAFSMGFGRFARVFVGETPGWVVEDPNNVAAEDVLEHLSEIRDLEGFAVPADIYEEVEFIATTFGITRDASPTTSG